MGSLRGPFAGLGRKAVRAFFPGSSFHSVSVATPISTDSLGSYGVRVIGMILIHGHIQVNGFLDLVQIVALFGIAK